MSALPKKYFLNILFFIFSVIYTISVSDYYQYIFEQDNIQILFYKFISFIIIATGFQYILKILKELYVNKRSTVVFTGIFLLYFFVNFIFFILTRGGVYNGDEIGISDIAVFGDIKTPTGHYLTAIFYIISYCIFPFPKSPVLLMIILMSLITAYIYKNADEHFDLKYKFLCLIPFLLPPVIRMNLQPLRSNICYMIMIFIFAYLYFRGKKEEKISYKEAAGIGVITAIMCVWRNENVILVPLLPIVLKILLPKIIGYRQLIVYTLIFITLTVAGIKYTESYAYKYKTISIIRPLCAILQTDFKSDDKDKDWEIISEVYDPDELLNTPADQAIFVKYNENITPEKIDKLFPLYLKLLKGNFKTYVTDRIKVINEYKDIYFLRDSAYYYHNLNDIKEKTINMLEFRDKNYNYTFLCHIAYNLFIPAIILILTVMTGIRKRNKYLIIIPGMSLAVSTVICLTCGEQYFHYYIQTWLLGYFMLFLYICIAVNKKLS